MSDSQNLGQLITTIGMLMGLISKNGDNININKDWFNDPISELNKVGGRFNMLTDLLQSVLGPKVDYPPEVFQDAQWYPIPDIYGKSDTLFHMVVPKQPKAGGEIGLGILHPFGFGTITVTSFVYIPLFSFNSEGAEFILTSMEKPCKLGLWFVSKDRFQVDKVSFAKLTIESSIYLGEKLPDLALMFWDFSDGSSKTPMLSKSPLDPTVQPWLAEVLLQADYWLHLNVGGSFYTIGDLLAAAYFLSPMNDQGEFHLILENLSGKDGKNIALQFIFAILDTLCSMELPLITLPGGGIYIEHCKDTQEYGIRLAADIPLVTDSEENPTAPEVTLSLGSWLTGESDEANWVKRITGAKCSPGLALYFLKYDGGQLAFSPNFTLNSIGLNLSGSNNTPLINTGGFTLGGTELRAHLRSSDWRTGFAVRLDDIGLPLGPSFDQVQHGGHGSNPVAGSLLASGEQGGVAQSGDAVNPVFSAKAGYVRGFSPLLEILDPQGNRTDRIWFPIQRRFGPLNCQKIGVKIVGGSDNPILGMLFDGGITLPALDVYLDQLAINIPLKHAADVTAYDLDLQGMDVAINESSVTVSGGLLKNDSGGMITYNGEALIRFQDLTIAALGSFGSLPDRGGISLFIFGMLNEPLGGAAFCFVTGVAAGFGYNRYLRIPNQNEIHDFPLVQLSKNGGANARPDDALKALQQKNWVPAQRGEYWLAAGFQFTTFEIIKTQALLVAEFGKDFVISVIGVSTLKQPQKGTAYVYAELDIGITYRPEQGALTAGAVLAPGSYVFTSSAHLIGGFAFCAWFENNEHSGDFVFTMGGYHPAFKVPAHYPQEPRLQINWQVNDNISITGDAYFAITPTAMMAGGGLQLLFHDGPLRAWLKAQIDMILFWKPFYMIAVASVSVGVSFHVHFLFIDKTFSVEIGAEFQLWGPPIGGSVGVDWYIISFTISFGDSLNRPDELSWKDFKEILPHRPQPTEPNNNSNSNLRLAAAANPDKDKPGQPAYLYINANDGLQRLHQDDNFALWLIRPGQFRFSALSAIPASKVTISDNDSKNSQHIVGSPVGVPRLNGGIAKTAYQSDQTVTVYQLPEVDVETLQAYLADPSTIEPKWIVQTAGWQIDPVNRVLPQAMWDTSGSPGQDPVINPEKSTITGTVGVTMTPKPRILTNDTPEMLIDQIFTERSVNPDHEDRLPLSQIIQSDPHTPQLIDPDTDISGGKDQAVITQRNTIMAAWQALNGHAQTLPTTALAGESNSLESANMPDVVFVPTPPEVVDAMLKLAKVNESDHLYDLGCGDGRILIKAAADYGAKCVGIDIDPERLKETEANVRQAGVTGRVSLIRQNLFEADVHGATVVTLYLLERLNLRLRPLLLSQLKPGTRIVSHAFSMGDWAPEQVLTVDGERIYLWTVPGKMVRWQRWRLEKLGNLIQLIDSFGKDIRNYLKLLLRRNK